MKENIETIFSLALFLGRLMTAAKDSDKDIICSSLLCAV